VDHRAARPGHQEADGDDGPLQLSLLDDQDLAELTSDDFPGERAGRLPHPVLAATAPASREDCSPPPKKLLAPVIARVRAGVRGAAATGVAVGKVISKHKTGKHFAVTNHRHQPDRHPQAGPDRRRWPPLDGLRDPHPAARQPARCPRRGHAYRTSVRRGDFRHIKADDLDCGPSSTGWKNAVKGHVLVCMLAAYLIWHLRQAWAP